MRVVLTSLHSEGADPDAWIARDTLRRELARALTARGHEVTVLVELARAAERRDGAVRWLFVPPDPLARAGRALLRGRPDAMVKAPSLHLLAPLARLRPEVIHSFDLVFYPTLLPLGRLARRLGAALVATFHGGAPARTRALRAVERRALAGVHRLLFTTRAQGLPWVASGALADDRRIAEVFEWSSTFRPGDPALARAASGLRGSPALLHTGRLDPVKDPLTTLRGLARLVRTHPEAHLTMCWTEAPLLGEVRRLAEGLPVTLLGTVPEARMEALLRGADALVQASRREVCGRAVVEALACGVAPVLSDIPPFRRLLDDGRVGRLFAPGDPEALAAAAADALAARAAGALGPEVVRGWFDAAISFPALAATVEAVYDSCLQEMSTAPARSRQGPASQDSSSA